MKRRTFLKALGAALLAPGVAVKEAMKKPVVVPVPPHAKYLADNVAWYLPGPTHVLVPKSLEDEARAIIGSSWRGTFGRIGT